MSRKSVAMVRVWVGAGVLGAVLLSGCQPSGGATTPPPSISPFLPTEQTGSPSVPPSSVTTPTPSGLVVTARPTTPEETAALAAEAEAVYREMRRLMEQYESQGGAATLPEPLKAYVDGIYATAIEASLKTAHDGGHSIEGPRVIHRLETFLESLDADALIGVAFCDDDSKRTFVTKEGKRIPLTGRLMNRAEFSRGTDGKLRMTSNSSSEVDACA